MAFDSVLLRQLPLIRKIIADETWLEAERRGCAVTADDPVVRENVCRIVLEVGAAMRETLTHDLAGAPQKLPPGDNPKQIGGLPTGDLGIGPSHKSYITSRK